MPTSKLLLFGGSGSIGAAVHARFLKEGWQVTVVSRSERRERGYVRWDPSERVPASGNPDGIHSTVAEGPFDAVCWAQGMNCTDSVVSYDQDLHEAMYKANVLYVLNSMHTLLARNLLRAPARLCVISSIWQGIARQSKLSYCVTKSALQGLVLSAAVDLAQEGHVINAVLPGVIDTPMTRANLKPEQVRGVEEATFFGRLPTLEEVASCVYTLCGSDMTAVTGQFINVDLGYSRVRVI
jgi:3-oxoacyl-[acyl-carrier protein] reductase